jgi:hypothetical protein
LLTGGFALLADLLLGLLAPGQEAFDCQLLDL